MPISIPAGVDVKIEAGNLVTVKGPKGTLTQQLHPAMTITQEGEVIHVTRPNDAKENRSLHGLTRSLLHNMIVGVTEGFKKELDVNGVGYRVAKEGNKLVMNLGYSHQVTVEETDGISIECPSANKIVISGVDKQKVGQFAAEVRERGHPPQGRQDRRQEEIRRCATMINRPDTNAQRLKRHKRVRGKISGTPERPRLNVFRSNTNIYAQVIDDVTGKTLASASSLEKGFEGKGSDCEAAKKVGLTVAERAKAAGIETVVFDRGGYVYHGRVQALAEGAREGGLQF